MLQRAYLYETKNLLLVLAKGIAGVIAATLLLLTILLLSGNTTVNANFNFPILAGIFILVLGIYYTPHFFRMFNQLGLTRKNQYLAEIISSALVALISSLSIILVGFLFNSFVQFFHLNLSGFSFQNWTLLSSFYWLALLTGILLGIKFIGNCIGMFFDKFAGKIGLIWLIGLIWILPGILTILLTVLVTSLSTILPQAIVQACMQFVREFVIAFLSGQISLSVLAVLGSLLLLLMWVQWGLFKHHQSSIGG